MSTQIRGNKQIKSITITDAQIAQDAAISTSKLAEGSELLKRDGSVVATGDFDLGNNQLKNVAAPVDDNDAVRKADLDAVSSGSSVFREIPTGTLNGSNTQFTLANTPNLGTEQVFLNGALLNSGANSDYVLEGSTLTFTLAPQSGDVVLVNYITDAIVVSLDVSNTINQLNSRLTTAEGELFTAQSDITNLASDVSGINSRLTSAEGDIVAVESDVSTLQSTVSAVQGSISSLQSDLSDEQAARIAADDALDTTVGSIQTSVTSLGNRMTTAEGDITSLEAADAAFDIRAGVIEDGLQAETSARTNADSALSSRVTTLENAPAPVTALSALTDVTITSPSADQILKYNGTGWVNGAAPATFSGSYNDLADKPSLFSGSYTDLTNKPSLFSGSYNDLTDKPTIPSALDDLSDVVVSSATKGHFIVHNGTSFVNSRTIEADVAATVPLTLKGAASQTANLFEARDSAGTALASISAGGVGTFNGGVRLKAGGIYDTSNLGAIYGVTGTGSFGGSNYTHSFYGATNQPTMLVGSSGIYPAIVCANGASEIFRTSQYGTSISPRSFETWAVALTVNNNHANPTTIANFQSNSVTKVSFSKEGNITASGTGTFNAPAAASKGLIVKGAASQSANLFEAQNSSGSALFSIDKDGSVAAGTVPVARVSGLADVATSGSYADLSNKPTVYTPVKEVLTALVDGTETEFVLADTPNAGAYVQVFLNGLLQSEGATEDYTISGDMITFNTAPDAGWKLVVYYFV